jgi:acyl carrier protein
VEKANSISAAVSTLESVKRVLAAEVGANETAEVDTRLADLPGWSSLGFMRVLVALESEFQIQYQIEDLVNVATIGDLCRFVERTRKP